MKNELCFFIALLSIFIKIYTSKRLFLRLIVDYCNMLEIAVNIFLCLCEDFYV